MLSCNLVIAECVNKVFGEEDGEMFDGMLEDINSEDDSDLLSYDDGDGEDRRGTAEPVAAQPAAGVSTALCQLLYSRPVICQPLAWHLLACCWTQSCWQPGRLLACCRSWKLERLLVVKAVTCRAAWLVAVGLGPYYLRADHSIIFLARPEALHSTKYFRPCLYDLNMRAVSCLRSRHGGLYGMARILGRAWAGTYENGT